MRSFTRKFGWTAHRFGQSRAAAAVCAVFLAACLLAWPAPAQAAPARPHDVPITQPDGYTFTARPWGDEYAHGMQTADGDTILFDEASRAWVYAVEQDGALAPARSGGRLLVVGQADAPSGSRAARPAPSREQTERSAAPGAGPDLLRQNQGSQRLLIIRVNFRDVALRYTEAAFKSLVFGASGSIVDYYAQASFGKLTILPAMESYGALNDGMVEVTLNEDAPLGYYNTVDMASKYYAGLILNAANPYVNFAQFDANGDGYIVSTELHIIFIIAGYEESYCSGYCDYTLPVTWAHRGSFASLPALLDGKYVGYSDATHSGGYAMFGEVHGENDLDAHIATVGVMVHELGHDLSWPDLYDTDGNAGGAWNGVGAWSVMGNGSWNTFGGNDGNSPALPDAFLKMYQGWIQPLKARNLYTYNLRPDTTANAALLVGAYRSAVAWDFRLRSGSGEYWLVENRQKAGYDAGLPGCGILIWHVNESAPFSNLANANPSAPLLALEQADGLNQLGGSVWNRGDTGDPFPGTSNNLAWGPATNPNSRYYNGTSSGRSLTINSSTCGTVMTVGYSGPGVEVFAPLIFGAH